MIPELGHFSLILALALAGLLATIPLLGVHLQRDVWMRSAGSLAAGLFTFLLLSFVCLTWSFLTDDFSVSYVAQNSNSQLPAQYKFSAVWGARRTAIWLGITSMLGSLGWFTAFTLQTAAYVFALGQVELIFSLVASVLFFRETVTRRELAGISVLGLSIILLVAIG